MTNPHNSPMSVSWLSYRFIIDVWSTSLPAIGAESLTGEVLYRQHCGACHGNDGEGTSEHFPRTLTGDKAIPRLAKFILKAMPPDEPGVLGAEDTERVAAYIHNAFYSRVAQW